MTRTALSPSLRSRFLRRGLLASLVVLGFAAAAEAREETVRWTHSLPADVTAFHIQVGTSPGSANLMDQSIGKPAPNAQGIYTFTVDVNTEETIYVRMLAVSNQDVASDPSNTITRSVPLGMPGQPIVQAP
jgi:hypothetical protein